MRQQHLGSFSSSGAGLREGRKNASCIFCGRWHIRVFWNACPAIFQLRVLLVESRFPIMTLCHPGRTIEGDTFNAGPLVDQKLDVPRRKSRFRLPWRLLDTRPVAPVIFVVVFVQQHVVVPRDTKLPTVRLPSKPLHKVQHFIETAVVREVSTVDQHVPIGPRGNVRLPSYMNRAFFASFCSERQRWQLLVTEVRVADADEAKGPRGLRPHAKSRRCRNRANGVELKEDLLCRQPRKLYTMFRCPILRQRPGLACLGPRYLPGVPGAACPHEVVQEPGRQRGFCSKDRPQQDSIPHAVAAHKASAQLCEDENLRRRGGRSRSGRTTTRMIMTIMDEEVMMRKPQCNPGSAPNARWLMGSANLHPSMHCRSAH